MTRLGWRARIWLERAIPHTPTKRWAYGVALVAALILGVRLSWWQGAVIFGAAALVRWIDIRRAAARRPRLPTTRAYFFEGADSDALDR